MGLWLAAVVIVAFLAQADYAVLLDDKGKFVGVLGLLALLAASVIGGLRLWTAKEVDGEPADRSGDEPASTGSSLTLNAYIARACFPIAAALLFAALSIEDEDSQLLGILLVTSGALLILRGMLMLMLRDDVLRPLAQREARGLIARLGLNIALNTTYGAVLGLVIGLLYGWTGIQIVLDAPQP